MQKAPRPYVPSNLRCVTLPVTDKPQEWDAEGFELDEEGKRKEGQRIANGKEHAGDSGALRSVEESLVLLQSLQQTRQHHVQELFPIFTTTQGGCSKNKATQAEEENSIPKHNIRLIGKCGLTVGPVSFQNVSLWECRFLEYHDPVPPPRSKTPPPPPVSQNKSASLTPSLVDKIQEQQVKYPWLQRLISQTAHQGSSKDDLAKLVRVVDYLRAGLPLPPPLPNGDAPEVPQLPKQAAPPPKQAPPPVQPKVARPPSAASCWQPSKDKAPVLLVSFEENPSTKFAIPVQLSFISYSNSQAPPEADSPGVTDNMLSQGEDDTITIEMFLPCRGWGKWENTPDLSRHYRTITTRRSKGNIYGHAAAEHKMLLPLPVDAKNDFGPIGGISIPAGFLEPIAISLTDLEGEVSTRVRNIVREIENFRPQDRVSATVATSSATEGSFGSVVQSMQGIEPTQSDNTPGVNQGATSQSEKSRESDTLDTATARKRSRRSETRGPNGEKSRSASPAGNAPDRPVGGKPWKVQLFERLLERVPKRAFLKCRLPSPVPQEIVKASIANNPSKPVIVDLTQKSQAGKKVAAQNNSRNDNPSVEDSRKRKADDLTSTANPEMPVTLDSLEEAIVKATAVPLVDEAFKASKRSTKPTVVDDSDPCQGCGQVGLIKWRKGPNGVATLCKACGDKFAKGTLGPLVAPDARPSSGRAKVIKTLGANGPSPSPTAATAPKKRTLDDALPSPTPNQSSKTPGTTDALPSSTATQGETQDKALSNTVIQRTQTGRPVPTPQIAPLPQSAQSAPSAPVAAAISIARKETPPPIVTASLQHAPTSTIKKFTTTSEASVVPVASYHAQRLNESSSTGSPAVPSLNLSTSMPRAPARPTPAAQSNLASSVSQQRPYYVVASRPQYGPPSGATQQHRLGAMSYVPYVMPPGYPARVPGQMLNVGSPYPGYGYPSGAYYPKPISPQSTQFAPSIGPSTAGSVQTGSSSVRSTQPGASSVRSTQTGSPGHQYHIPDPNQGYIPPRPIMPSSIRNPLMETVTTQAQPDPPHSAPAVPYRAAGGHANIQNTPRESPFAFQQTRPAEKSASAPARPVSAGANRVIAGQHTNVGRTVHDALGRTQSQAFGPQPPPQRPAVPTATTSGAQIISVRPQIAEPSARPQ